MLAKVEGSGKKILMEVAISDCHIQQAQTSSTLSFDAFFLFDGTRKVVAGKVSYLTGGHLIQ